MPHENIATRRSPIVLVHGAWGGAWIWRRVLPALREAGNEVHAVTLTGDGERAHLRTPEINLQTHIDDVVGVIEAEELEDVILVGHSYGGLVITGAAARLQAADPGRIGGLVYVDAMVPMPGEGWGVSHSAEVAQARIAAAAEHGGALPPPDVSEGFGVSPADAEWLARRHVPHPFGMYREPLHFDVSVLDKLPRQFIDCTAPAYPTIEPSRVRVREQPGWRVTEIHTGHFPMVSEPDALTRQLLEFTRSIPAA